MAKKISKPQGRPREHDRDKIALDMIEWAKKPDSINLCKFCAYYEPIIPPSKISKWADECDDFRQAYEAAKMFLGFRREEMLSQETLHVKAYDLNATVYDYFLDEKKTNTSKFEAALRKESEQKPTEIIIKVANEGLGIGSGVSTKKISTTVSKRAKQRN